MTTNWDFFLQREVDLFNRSDVKPTWLVDSQVWRLNGTIEDWPNQPHRSPFLLPDDPNSQRCPTTEGNTAYNDLIRNARMSFDCGTDKFILHQFNLDQDRLLAQ